MLMEGYSLGLRWKNRLFEDGLYPSRGFTIYCQTSDIKEI